MSQKPFDRAALEQLIIRRFFYAPAFQLYGGVTGLFDYGPTGCALLNNIISIWRNHFVRAEDMLELDTTILTPSQVLETSGHVEKFSDWMCKDIKTGDIFRADHIVEAVLENRLLSGGDNNLNEAVRKEYEHTLAQIDNYGGEELDRLIKKYDIRSPDTGNPLSTPQAFNLMFDCNIGPTGQLKGYLRPETAQGQFLNFKRLLEFNNDKMPFASAQVGRSFRNEISPRSGLLRVREFTMAEIEHFVDPDNKTHPHFNEIKSVIITLLPKDIQLAGKTDTYDTTVGEAVNKKIIDNETLGYFIARIYLFLIKIGIKHKRLRFRQHMDNEMAHYATDCWDAEIHTSYGWIECVGCADRSAYDLTVHSLRTKEKLVVRQQLESPRIVEKWKLEINKTTFGPKYKKNAKGIEDALLSYTDACYEKVQKDLETNGNTCVKLEDGSICKVSKDDITVSRGLVTEHIREFTPNVIEPSFGIGRILYSLLEHSWWIRDDDRQVLSFPTLVAPFKCCLLPLSGQPCFDPFIKNYSRQLRKCGISTRTDDSKSSIGRRYSRNDELGIPFAITVDFQTVKDHSVTLRQRDSTKQIRDSFENIINIIKDASVDY